MTILPVRRRWLYTLVQLGAILTITTIGTLGIGVRIFQAQAVAPHEPPLSTGVQFLFLVILAAFIWFGGRASILLLRDSLTQFTSLGIQRPLWSTPSFIPWSTIHTFLHSGDAIIIVTPTQRTKMRSSVFQNPSELVARLQPYLSNSERLSNINHTYSNVSE